MNKDLLQRMKSIKQTVQISNAQKLVAATKIGKACRMLAESKPYHNNIIRAIADVLGQFPDLDSNYIEPGRSGGARRGLLVLSANRGLAGGFNANIIHFAEESLRKKPAAYVIVLGQACRNQLIQKGFPVDKDYDQPLDPPTMFTARELAEKVTGMLDNGRIDAFDIIYTNYKSSIRMEPVQERLFPLSPLLFEGAGLGKVYADFEPAIDQVIASIVLKYLKGFLYGCLVHTWICELTSRVTAMDNAIRNGNEMLDHLSLVYNRARQAAITQEITEIVAGAAAMQGED